MLAARAARQPAPRHTRAARLDLFRFYLNIIWSEKYFIFSAQNRFAEKRGFRLAPPLRGAPDLRPAITRRTLFCAPSNN
jgi:hypothetical protein